jgi:Ras-related protein Rab-6A
MNSNLNPETPKYKLIFLGDQGVGKSCILNRFLNDTFTEDYQATIGLDFQSKNVQIENQDIHLLLYDTAGQEKFRSLIPMYTRDANIVLLVYDISNRDSFSHLPDWLKDLTNVNFDEVIFAIVANKIDLSGKRDVTAEEGQKFADEHNFIFQEISAKTGIGFSELFYKNIFEKIRTKFRPSGQQPASEINDIKFNIEQDGKKTETKKNAANYETLILIPL